MSTFNDPLVTLKQFASELGVCVKTIYRLIDAGKLPKPVKIGHSTRFPRSVLNSYREKIGAPIPTSF